jgi:hypothetical protein
MAQREIFYFDNWDAQQVVYPKNLSVLLLDKHGSLLDWGYRARQRMYKEGLVDGGQYVSNFKRWLRPPAESQSPAVAPMNTAEASRMTGLYIRELYRTALRHITQGGLYTEDDVTWAVTVPAVWDDYSRDLMHKAVVAAGMPDGDRRLVLVPEPEVAALHCLACGERALIEPGCRFLVVNAGDDAVDITSYQVEPGLRLSQLSAYANDEGGQQYLSKFFITDVLCERLGTSFVTDLKAEFPMDFWELVEAWVRVTHSFVSSAHQPIAIPLTATVYQQARINGAALDKLRQYQKGIDTAIVVRPDEVRDAFDKTAAPVRDAVAAELGRMRSASQSSGGETAVLVGKFAEFPYLKERLHEYLDSEGAALCVPPHPSTAIMTGAVHFAYQHR